MNTDTDLDSVHATLDRVLPQTPITRAFGIRHPILGGGMMWLSDPGFVAALGRAGCLGFMTARSFPDVAAFSRGLEQARGLAEGAPVGVNFTLSRHSDNGPVVQMLDAALEQGISAFETAGSLPEPDLIARIHAGGGILLHKCAALRHARAAQAAGADFVGLVGMEEGGHPGPGELPTSVLGALAARRLEVPLVLGGGIGSGGQIVSALALGADAVVMGSRFLACAEIWAHEAYKAAIVAADENASIRVFGSLGRTWRVLRNRTSLRVAEMEAAGERDYAVYAPLVSGALTRRFAYTEGDSDQGMLSCGPAIGFVECSESVARTVATLLAEARASLARLGCAGG
ncbi:nitronate monooxygenase [Verticiella sediminum]|uniref:Nitronate monooxygenase n=1 Tax=Verticiella sediminum TaxID=1247510 RepID=A0A556AWI4_9BURK|nr:nitronate monooxygenase [Verticiella sediminum]TSH97313.1 nitronate monooxygenase [Verticiella sediminum]